MTMNISQFLSVGGKEEHTKGRASSLKEIVLSHQIPGMDSLANSQMPFNQCEEKFKALYHVTKTKLSRNSRFEKSFISFII